MTEEPRSVSWDGAPARVVGRGHRACVRVGDLAWVGAHALATPDPRAGARAAFAAIEGVLREEGLALDDLVRIGVYYDMALDDAEVVGAIRQALPSHVRPVITKLPVRHPAVPGAAVVVDAAAAAGGPRLTFGDDQATRAVRVGDKIWVGGVTGRGPGIREQTSDVLEKLRSTAAESGTALDDCVKINIGYVGDGTEADWEPTARLRGSAFQEPAAAATGIPYPRLPGGVLTQVETLIVAGSAGTRQHGWPEDHWDWPIHLPWKHACRAGDLVTIGGQVSLRGRGEVVDPADLGAQTMTALGNIDRALATVGARMWDVTQLTAFFEGSPSDLETVLARTRSAFGERPPPIVPVPLPFLAYRQMVVEIEVIAVVGRS